MEERMKEDLLKLLEAQDLDLEIDQLLLHKHEYPQQIEFCKNEITDLKQSTEDLKAIISETEESLRDTREEIQAEKENLVKKEKRLLETKTNKEYNAVQSEIEQARNRIDNLETEEIELYERLGTLEPQQKEHSEKLEGVTAVNTARIEELERNLGSIASDIIYREQKRETVLAGVNKRLLAIYLRLRKGRRGIAVARVNKSKFSCTGCNKHLPPQKVMEVRRANVLITCENCGRILVWDERGGEEGS
jgi:predicted  nucleic acid-binding Zn-ribbon protein